MAPTCFRNVNSWFVNTNAAPTAANAMNVHAVTGCFRSVRRTSSTMIFLSRDYPAARTTAPTMAVSRPAISSPDAAHTYRFLTEAA